MQYSGLESRSTCDHMSENRGNMGKRGEDTISRLCTYAKVEPRLVPTVIKGIA